MDGKATGDVELPQFFTGGVKLPLIIKAVSAIQSNKRQPYGTDPLAGARSSAHYHGSRHYRFSMMNKEMARISRIHGKVGYLAMTARVVVQAVKGRRGMPPRAEKIWTKKINRKEMAAAIKSLIAATASKEMVKARGHRYVNELPVVIVNDFENVSKAKEIHALLEKILGKEEMERCSERKVRAGRGKTRGRKYKVKAGPLLIFSKHCPAMRASAALPGVASATASSVSADILAPGAQPGRLTVYTQSALEELKKRLE
ncbi:MAG: 50S ribosomal protein L4 [Candidatus Aenigmarchaeota archaeon]|nr:50S ribosomal protein L4 [Candidatus Aenigmarchaeota archaeon]